MCVFFRDYIQLDVNVRILEKQNLCSMFVRQSIPGESTQMSSCSCCKTKRLAIPVFFSGFPAANLYLRVAEAV